MVGMDDVADAVVDHRRLVVVTLLVVIGAVGAGAAQVEDSASLSQFETSSDEAEKLEYVDSNFGSSGNTTTVQVIVREDNVLARESLLEQLRFERALVEDDSINRTLDGSQAPAGIANVVATAAIREGQAANLTERGRALGAERQRLNETGARLSDALNRTRGLQRDYVALNRSHAAGEVDDATYRQRSAAIERNLTAVRTDATAGLSANQSETFGNLTSQARTLQSRLAALNASYERGEINESTYRQRSGEIQAQFGEVYAGIERVLAPDARALEERAAALQADRAALQERAENGSTPPLADQIDRIESMNASAVEASVERVLSEGSGTQAFALMPTSYDLGSTSADATMIVVTQTTESAVAQGSASARLQNSQTEIQDVARDRLSGDAMVFGAGIIADETNRSMQDSLTVVGPFAILFVLVVLTVAYRDLLDILLGVFGLALTLLLTFGYMGWTGVAFNQLFVAIPVLLIGLSIDYAIHVFMRHREAREARSASDGRAGSDATREARGTEGDGGDPAAVAGSMRTALAGVGTALVLVTATTVIGFLSNLTSPVGPIREFGIVSAVGIVGALVVFGALIPAIKVEVDAVLEGRGFDRRKRAFGTGGGAFGRLLEAGATAADRAPWAVILATLLISAGGAYGATEVDTSFAQTDFIAEEPPEWMDNLPEEMRPGEYSMRATFEYVNDNFLREDATAEFLFEGEVATGDALQRVNRTGELAAEKGVTVELSNGEADVRSPLTVMRSVAATNETFNATLAASDTDGDGVPDRDVAGVFDALYETAPDQARQYVQREDGEYEALLLTASLRGGASGSAVTTQMDAVESAVSGGDVTVTATGRPIVNEIVQSDLLTTVVESLIITLVVSFVFLMVVYRVAEGSATLGLVTLLPVVFNVSWILGTMYLLEIPFNVLTGMITSLTIGLGVAYSIHLSERFSLELDRRESGSEAMHTAVTGTGGALLGSAATTVGGFGVLVFAILPPLQQFGFITGLTIVYAFLASVFVLPSLLAVWSRHFGPAGAFDADGTGDDGSDGGAPTADPIAGGADGRSPAVDEPAGAADGVSSGVGSAGSSGAATAATPTAGARTNGDAVPYATRSVEPTRVYPGGTARVTVALPSASGRVVLRETPSVGSVSIDRVSPEPVERVAADGRVYAVWELDAEDGERAELEYTLAVPAGLADGETVAFDGELLLPDHAVPVAGPDAAPVTTDVAGAVIADGPVDERGIADAGRHLAAGRLSPEAFERVTHAWLDEHASDAPTGESPPGANGSGANGSGASDSRGDARADERRTEGDDD
ncbi:MMPL family transporter [Halosimplex rubrum]|uniref:MMPL family transporter n=1 Tax=Halosimplex rubrum TaxID=869889 RepID=A0A7D5P0L4_9EURY|nr:MMPL family transporter [Halosimplex rubrum]QLH77677.1 MMPL family transporter [Halosimplex rubrum]